jgi:hypothetical protein
MNRLPGLHELMGYLVSLNQMSAQFDEHLAHN